jgi:hypothetical protein
LWCLREPKKHPPPAKKNEKKREKIIQFYYYYYSSLPRKRPATKSKIQEEMVEDGRGRSSCYYTGTNHGTSCVQRKKKQPKRKRDKSERMQKTRGKKNPKKNIQEKKPY